jgi:ADP-heptose:LPS heptosyltransferase
MPEVDAVLTKGKKDPIRTVARTIREAGPFDAAILCTNSTRSTLELARGGVPRLVGYHGSLRARWLHQICPEPPKNKPPEHHAWRYLRLARYCGALTKDPELFHPPAPPTGGKSLRIGICAGAEYGPAKRWPLERFAAVATVLSAHEPGIEWVLFGAPGEKAMGEKLSGMMGAAPHRNLVGVTTLTGLIAEIRNCRLLLTNDTGTMHLAAALGVPTVSLFGSTEPVLTGPVGPGHRIVRHHVPCSPCFKRECPFGHYDCMTGVTVERVVGEVSRALQSPEPARPAELMAGP